MSKIVVLVKTINRLGVLNVIYVVFYKFLTIPLIGRFLYRQRKFEYNQNLFNPINYQIKPIENSKKYVECADKIIAGEIRYYSYHKVFFDSKPNWFLNPFNNQIIKNNNIHWTRINDFNSRIGDVKNIWEASRFNWIGTLAFAYLSTKDNKYLSIINHWVNDWKINNPINTGPNWKCGQEASIRLINVFLADDIINSKQMNSSLIEFYVAHLDRILSTTFYARAQNNNHVISEGVALYIIGYRLKGRIKRKKYKRYMRKGLSLIEVSVEKLIMQDGTFSQYSVTYHRMMLDLLTLLEIYRQKWELHDFSKKFYKKVKNAILWYHEMIDPNSGDAPNIGANDGTYLFNFDNKYYRDFRPTLNFSSIVFDIPLSQPIKEDHSLIHRFNLSNNSPIKSKTSVSRYFKNGGFTKLVRDNGMIIIRVPNFKFRPSHSDSLHIDLWQDGINWIRDAGSFSYALNDKQMESYSGAIGHSTVIFNNSSHMPKISRFLFGEWIQSPKSSFSPGINSFKCTYNNYLKFKHSREILATKNGWKIIDIFSGPFKNAMLQWRLPTKNWRLSGKKLFCNNATMIFDIDKSCKLKLIKKEESLYYMHRSYIPVLRITASKSNTITTNIYFD